MRFVGATRVVARQGALWHAVPMSLCGTTKTIFFTDSTPDFDARRQKAVLFEFPARPRGLLLQNRSLLNLRLQKNVKFPRIGTINFYDGYQITSAFSMKVMSMDLSAGRFQSARASIQ